MITTFQALVYSVIHGMSQFLPISSKAHLILIPYLVGWQPPSAALMAALTCGSFLALFIYFRHDWASMISCFLQVVIYRKKPMTLDERLPLFLGITTLPLIFASYYFREKVIDVEWNPLVIAGILAFTGLPLWFFDSINRKLKGMFDWSWFNAAFVGLIQASALLPGWDPVSGILLGASFLNFRREAATKYAYFALAPIVFTQCVSYTKDVDFHAAVLSGETSWLSLGVALVVTFLVGLLTIGGFMKHMQQKGLGQYVFYRWGLALGVAALYWYRNHGL